MIRQYGVEPTVIEYLKTSPSSERIIELVAAVGISLWDALRKKGKRLFGPLCGEA